MFGGEPKINKREKIPPTPEEQAKHLEEVLEALKLRSQYVAGRTNFFKNWNRDKEIKNESPDA